MTRVHTLKQIQLKPQIEADVLLILLVFFFPLLQQPQVTLLFLVMLYTQLFPSNCFGGA
jgi:hypothetical protein